MARPKKKSKPPRIEDMLDISDAELDEINERISRPGYRVTTQFASEIIDGIEQRVDAEAQAWQDDVASVIREVVAAHKTAVQEQEEQS